MPAARPSPHRTAQHGSAQHGSAQQGTTRHGTARQDAPAERRHCRCGPDQRDAPLPRVRRLSELHRQQPHAHEPGRLRQRRDPHARLADPGGMLREPPRRRAPAEPCRAAPRADRRPPRPHTRGGGAVADEPRRAAAWYARALADVVHGHRALPPLLHHTTSGVYRELERLRASLCRGGVRAAPGRPAVRSWHVFSPGPDVLEVSAHLVAGGRSTALAFRLERDDRERWRCTAVQAAA